MPRDPLIGLVGKPSSGKSTMLNRWVFILSFYLESDFSFYLLFAINAIVLCDLVARF